MQSILIGVIAEETVAPVIASLLKADAPQTVNIVVLCAEGDRTLPQTDSTRVRFKPISDFTHANARNALLDLAEYEDVSYLFCVDPACEVRPNWLSEMMAAIGQMPDAQIFQGPCMLRYDGNGTAIIPREPLPIGVLGCRPPVDSCQNFVLRRDVFSKAGYTLRFDSDLDLADDSSFFERATTLHDLKNVWVPQAMIERQRTGMHATLSAQLKRRRANMLSQYQIRQNLRVRHGQGNIITNSLLNIKGIVLDLALCTGHAMFAAIRYPINTAKAGEQFGNSLLRAMRIAAFFDFLRNR